MSALQDAVNVEVVALRLGLGLYSARNSDLMEEATAATESLLTTHPSVRVTFYRMDLLLEDGKSHFRDADLTENEDTIVRSKITASLHSRLGRVFPRTLKPTLPARDHATECMMPFNCAYDSFTPSVRAAIFSRIVRYAIEIPRGGYVRQDFQDRTWADLDGVDLRTAFALQLTNRDLKVRILADLQKMPLTRCSFTLWPVSCNRCFLTASCTRALLCICLIGTHHSREAFAS